MQRLLEQKLQGPDQRADRDDRVRGLCCARIGNGSWCMLADGHDPKTSPHTSVSKPSYGPLRDPQLKFAIGIKGRWVDPKPDPADS